MRLDGVKILDLSGLLPGPYATQLLADLGAHVITVEDTERGDPGRDLLGSSDGDGRTLFGAVNRGKQSVAIDLKSDDGREVFYALTEDADAVLEGFRPGVADRLGVDYETLRTYNEDIAYCSLSGYGQTGPYADRAGHDINYVGLSGLLDMTREDEQTRPQVPGYQIADFAGGLFAGFALLGELLSRELGHGAGSVDVSMTDVVASFTGALAPAALGEGDPRPGDTPLTGAYPWYDVYQTGDDRYLTLGALEPKFWQQFCEAVGRADLTDVHGTHDPAERAALREELTELFASRPRDEWLDRLGDETATAPVLTPAEAFEHPQVADRIVRRPQSAPPRIGFPACGPDRPEAAEESIPNHGEHTDAVLRTVGFGDSEIETLRERGVVK